MVKIFACKITEIVSGQMKKIAVDGKEIVVSNVDGNYFAIDDTCTHSGAVLQRENLMVQWSLVIGMVHNLTAKMEN